eukprot:CAMPEP_0113471224 /NCGR_PEP_ID=MMETSP0014_2-20120614/16866_1 /TAXON_ID=2857 /ORGANISM="Nitzschia sp." /LENGTH=349 /DNA_ID=CAMNT_0000363849 /DNA_START=135 /DNA_END=1184 /DNA_ORIENTATION=- /assembly_acc=CAM_ASM_000159
MTLVAVSLLATSPRVSPSRGCFATTVVEYCQAFQTVPVLVSRTRTTNSGLRYQSSLSLLSTRREQQEHAFHRHHPWSSEKIQRTHHRSSCSRSSSIVLSRLFSSSSSSTGGGSKTDDSFLLEKVLKFRGNVATGYGRGGKKLGVPTANLPASLFQNALKEVPTGVYFGWATIEENEKPPPSSDPDTSTTTATPKVHKAVVNVGYSPTFEGQENKEKIIEAHLISDDRLLQTNKESPPSSPPKTMDDFYGSAMRLQLIGFIRPERKFDSFDELITQINKDIDDAATMLSQEPYNRCKEDPFLFLVDPPVVVDSRSESSPPPATAWVGKSGGDDSGSWEFTPIEPFLEGLN